ncbi:unnamed protein product, partial [Brassica rapa]
CPPCGPPPRFSDKDISGEDLIGGSPETNQKQSPVPNTSPSMTSGDEGVTIYNTLVFIVKS